MNDITMLQCSRCKETKSSDNFGKHPTRGFQFYCKACMSEYRREHKPGNGQTKKDLTDVTERRCSWCHKMKPASEYWKHGKRGVQFYCKECMTQHYHGGNHCLSPLDNERQLALQNSVCACCQGEETRERNGQVQRLSADCSHTTGAFRALVCHACNTAIGAVEKYGHLRAQPERTAMIILYLEKFDR